MKTQVTSSRWRITIVAALPGVLAFGVAASAAPLRSGDAVGRMKDTGAVQEGPPAGATATTVLDDATRARGGLASGGAAEAIVFQQGNDSGFAWLSKDDDVFGLGTWATQQIFGNAFEPYMSISAYDILVYHSVLADPDVNASFMTELWTGDPYSIMDVVCADGGISAPIPNTSCTFTDLPNADDICPPIASGDEPTCAGLYRLRCELPTKTVIPCDRVWTVATMLEGCRAGWRVAGSGGNAWNEPAGIGVSNDSWRVYACEQLAACDTPNGYNSGTCCSDHLTPCDHTDGTPDCPTGHMTFCGDGVADFFDAAVGTPGGPLYSLVSTVYARTDTVMSMAVVSVDGPILGDELPAGVISLTEEEVVLSSGDHNVWLEFRGGDWDPDDTGAKLANWQLTFDSASYSSGAQGVLRPYVGSTGCGECAESATPCFTDADCAAGFCTGGGAPCHEDADCPVGVCYLAEPCEPTATGHAICETQLGRGARCDPPGYYLPAGTCSFAWIDIAHPNFIFRDLAMGPRGTIDISRPDVRPASSVLFGPAPDDPEPFPEGGMYAGSIVVSVPSDAKGTFTMTVLPFPNSQLTDDSNQFVPLLGVQPAKITVQTGSCCFDLQDTPVGGEHCVDGITPAQCEDHPGLTAFEPGGSCNDPCPPVCGDGIADPPGEECDDGVDNSDIIPDACRTNCTLPACGDNLVDTGEECDGVDAASCPGACRPDCTCRVCGGGILDPEEECDGADDDACPGQCRSDCTCPVEIPTLSHWGLAVLALLLITGAKVWYRRSTAP